MFGLSSPFRPRLRWALAASLSLLVGACGDAPRATSWPLVELVASPLDGEPPREGLSVERAEPGAPPGSYPLTAVPGRPLVFEARGAPRGGYLLRMPGEWAMLGTPILPGLEPDARLTRIRVGRHHTLYLVSHRSQRPLGDTWALRRLLPEEQRGRAVPVRIEQDALGTVLIRVPPEEWRGTLELQGRFADGGLCEHWPFYPGEFGLPILRSLEPEPLAPLRVPVVGAAEGAETWVTARVVGLPLGEQQRAPVRDGLADFAGLPTTGLSLELESGEVGPLGPLSLPAGSWYDEGEIRLHARLAGARPVRLALPPGAPVTRCQIGVPGGPSFGLVAWREEAGALVLEAAPGAWRLLLTRGPGHAFGRFEVPVAGEPTGVDVGPTVPDAVVRGIVAGGDRGRLLWERLEGDVPVLAHGFVSAVRTGGTFAASLPPGTYRLTLESPLGPRDATRTLTLASGEQRSLSLDVPR